MPARAEASTTQFTTLPDAASGAPFDVEPSPSPGAPEEVLELKRALGARARGLSRGVAERLEVLAEVSRRWIHPADRYRQAGIRSLVQEGGYASATAAAGLDATFRPWTARAWHELARRELEGEEPLLGEAIPLVLGSALPAPNLLPLFFTLLLGAAPVARAGRHIPSFPGIALASVGAVDPELASCGRICRWPRARTDLTRALFTGARVGAVTGGDLAVEAIRSLLASGMRLLAHPRKVSFAWIGASALDTAGTASASAARLARDVALHDQQGCLSPVGVVVEGARPAELERFAHALGRALERLERVWPRGEPGPESATAIRSFHDQFAVGAGSGAEPRVTAGAGLTWIVGVLRRGEPVPRSPLFRCVWIRPVRELDDARRLLRPWRGATAALGFRGSATERARARVLARELGASRLCPVGRMQSPPLSWRRDGLRPLRDLLT